MTVERGAQQNAHDLLGALRESYTLTERWARSDFAWLKGLIPAQKGRIGEALFAGLAGAAGLEVGPRRGKGHDCRIGDARVEVKLSTSYDTADAADATVKWLQVRPDQGFDIVALLAVCPEHVHLWLVPKAVVLTQARGQHGGKGAKETKYLEVDPDAPPAWLGPDVAGTPRRLRRRFESLWSSAAGG